MPPASSPRAKASAPNACADPVEGLVSGRPQQSQRIRELVDRFEAHLRTPPQACVPGGARILGHRHVSMPTSSATALPSAKPRTSALAIAGEKVGETSEAGPSRRERRDTAHVMKSLGQMDWTPRPAAAGPTVPDPRGVGTSPDVKRRPTNRRASMPTPAPQNVYRPKEELKTRVHPDLLRPGGQQPVEASVRRVNASPTPALRNLSLGARSPAQPRSPPALPPSSPLEGTGQGPKPHPKAKPPEDSAASPSTDHHARGGKRAPEGRRPSPPPPVRAPKGGHAGNQPVPGLPARSDTAVLPFPDSPIEDGDPDRDSDVHSSCPSTTEPPPGGQEEADDQPLLAPAGPSSLPAFCQKQDVRAYPASEVFGSDAALLCLPRLDRYLSDRRIFYPPTFSDPRQLCSEEESDLFGFDAPLGKAKLLEVAGDQFRVPSEVVQRRRGRTPAKPTRKSGMTTEMEDLKAKEDIEEDDPFADPEEQAPGPTDVPAAAPPDVHPVPSELSSALTPSRIKQVSKDMFPPLMLLCDQSLDELKSNAVGPRKPPGGFLGFLPSVSSLLSIVVDFIVGLEGSSLAAGLFKLELLRDFFQMMAIHLHYVPAMDSSSPNPTMAARVRLLLLHQIPSVLALDFVSVFGSAVIFLFAWFGIVALLLLRFWRMSRAYNPNRTVEGFNSQPWLFKSPALGTKVTNVLVVFGLTTLYLPLSKLAVDMLTWSSDYWVVPNPYIGNDEPAPPPLGDATKFRDPLDFCWTTTMQRDSFNWAWVMLPLAALTVLVYTLWFPWLMVKTLRRLLPRVSPYNELGNRRSRQEMELEYLLLLNQDRSPLNFMYNDYSRRWGFYKPVYILCFKLTNLLVIALVNKNNCLGRSFTTRTMLVSQQVCLIVLAVALLVVHLYIKPFIDAISNRSELVSRVGYVLTAVIGLLVALNVEGSTVYQSTLLYMIQAFTYTGNVYLSFAGAQWFKRLVKRRQKRLDFSIDIFSPRLDLHKHIKRRVWEETLSTILLCGPSYHMPMDQVVAFSTSENWPPYLLYFQGSAAERHVENIKILKHVGIVRYRHVAEAMRGGHEGRRWRKAIRAIQSRFAGPDAYWRPLRPPYPAHVSSFFGKAFLVPFPPTLVMRYDQGAPSDDCTVQLTTLEELEAFVRQNEDAEVQSRRWVRLALRALHGMTVFCPHVDAQEVGDRSPLSNMLRSGRLQRRHDYRLALPVSYTHGVISVRTRHHRAWSHEDARFTAGFDVSITYGEGRRMDPEGLTVVTKPLTVDAAAALGLPDDFGMTPPLSRFLHDNEELIRMRQPVVAESLRAYRSAFHCEAQHKRRVMSYAFLADIWDAAALPRGELVGRLANSSCCRAVRELPARYPASVQSLYERLEAIQRSRVHQWWWLFWDDLWRQNAPDYALLRRHARSLNPAFPTSVAYQPLSRSGLEAFLAERGLAVDERGVFNNGVLNRLYFHLDELVRHATDGEAPVDSIRLGLPLKAQQQQQKKDLGDVEAGRGQGGAEKDGHGRGKKGAGADAIDGMVVGPSTYSDVAWAGRATATSSMLTGGGTAHDRHAILDRRAWPWAEQRLVGQRRTRWQKVGNAVLEWLSIRPYRLNADVASLYLYLYKVEAEDQQTPSSNVSSLPSRTSHASSLLRRRCRPRERVRYEVPEVCGT